MFGFWLSGFVFGMCCLGFRGMENKCQRFLRSIHIRYVVSYAS